MVTLRLTGTITEDGNLNVQLPSGEVEVTLELVLEELRWELRPWTEAELEELMKAEFKTGAEITASDVIGAWANYGIRDSAARAEELCCQEAKELTHTLDTSLLARIKRSWL
jgi:hypothetical protein